MQTPCYNCQDRWINEDTNERCHSTCKRYKMFVDANNKMKQNKRDMAKLCVIGHSKSTRSKFRSPRTSGC